MRPTSVFCTSSNITCHGAVAQALPLRIGVASRPQARPIVHRARVGGTGHLIVRRRVKRSLVTYASGSDDSGPGWWAAVQGALPNWLPNWLTGESDSEDYSKEMQKKMGSSLKYEHEKGIYYSLITDRLICGSCLQTAEDVDTIREKEDVGTILCLQEDKDMKWWNLDIVPIMERAKERGDIVHVREPVRDFDPFSLRQRLPAVVKGLVRDLETNPGKAYVHCTAGMGRAPGVVLAYMWWVDGYTLEDAYEKLFSVRPCHPQLKSIRAAACDMLSANKNNQVVTLRMKADGVALSEVKAAAADGKVQRVEIAGLHIGWDKRLELHLNGSGDYEAQVELPVGNFTYKFVVNGDVWVADSDSPTIDDGGNLNNVAEVAPSSKNAAEAEMWARLMEPGGDFTAVEKETMAALLKTPLPTA